MPRDETRDVWVKVYTETLGPLIEENCIADDDNTLCECIEEGYAQQRYIPASQYEELASAARVLVENARSGDIRLEGSSVDIRSFMRKLEKLEALL